MYLAELKNEGVSFFYLARDNDGRVVGFCSFWRVLDELHINNLAVLPEFRRAGRRHRPCWSACWRRGRGWARGARRSRCGGRTMPARQLYERFGFAVGRRAPQATTPSRSRTRSCSGAKSRT